MIARAAALALTTLAGFAAADTVTATGVVFDDRNGDGVRQPGERGIKSALVSDGRRIVEANAKGEYSIEIDAEDAILFVVKPAGYRVPLDAENKPRHFYIHKPGGSRDAGFLFEGVAPTGPLPASVDFPLTRDRSESDEFTVALFGDPQPYSQEQVEYFRRDIIEPMLAERDAGTLDFDFGVSLGDLVGDQLGLFQPLNEAQALFGTPWYNVYGNHDMNFMSGGTDATADDPDAHADETYERVYGPTDYAFRYGDAHFIVLDNVIYQGFNGFRDGTREGWPGGRWPVTSNYRGGLRDHQLEFIDNYLDHVDDDELVVLMFHVPVEMEGEGVHRIPEKGRLFEILSSHPRTLSISGHTHIQRHWFFGSEAGYTPDPSVKTQHTSGPSPRFSEPVHHHINAVTASGSWYRGPKDEDGLPLATMACGAPNGFTLLHISGNEYRSEFRAARAAAGHQMRLTTVPTETGDRLVANVFNGARGDETLWRLTPMGGRPGEWTPMTYTRMNDPVYSAMRESHAAIPAEHRSERELPRPQASSHIWTADLPGMPAGTHVVEVRHTDLYGVTRAERHTVRGRTGTLP
jgi:hypothetical protein